MISSIERPPIAVAVVLLGGLIACSPETRVVEPSVSPTARTGIELSSDGLRTGDTLQLRVIAESGTGEHWASVLGTLTFNPAELRYLGQPLRAPLTLVNVAAEQTGRLRVIGLQVPELGRVAADLRFEVLRPGYSAHLGYRLEEAVSPDLRVVYQSENLPVAVAARAPDSSYTISRPTLQDWWKALGLVERVRPAVAGAGRVFGDVTLNGIVDGLDASVVANLAVGNRELLVDPLRDNVIAGDVAPANSPGLGEADDPVPPGRNADGTFSISGLDAVVIANEAVGNDRPVAGEPIPGRQPRPFRVTVTGDITTDRTMTRDTVYELQGLVNVPGSVTLTIGAGTLIEGDGATHARLVVRRGGNIAWIGTRLEPIVFTCKGASKTPGCWGGVVINGLSLLNTTQSGGDSLTICPEKTSIGNPGLYGGCLVEDNSGTMRYVRVEYAGAPEGGAPTPGLALLGIGSATAVQDVQVHASLGDGLFVSGGTVNLRELVLTANTQSGLRWDDGYGGNPAGGNLQFVIVQQAPSGGDGIRGSNSAAMPDAGPRARPQLYNVTVVGSGAGRGSGRGIRLENGTGVGLRNSIITLNSGAGLDIGGTETCNQVSAGNLELDHSFFFGNTPDYSADADCIDEVEFGTNPVRANQNTDPGLTAPANTLTPDWRPQPGSPASSGGVSPPSNLFFDVTVTYFGAVDPADFLSRSNVPWFAGWTRTWSGAP